MSRRGKYSVIADVDRNRIIEAFENDQDWLALAEQLNIKRQSTRNLILRHRKSQTEVIGKKGRNEMKEKLISWVEENACITLKEMKEKL